jgi:hypothetical protein
VRLSYTQDWRTQEFIGQKRYFHYGSFNLSYAWVTAQPPRRKPCRARCIDLVDVTTAGLIQD